ncbi:MAG: adenylate/guanylate cyclase domain-containing protein [Actinobacteria bacterium]|nr:adenylate/guanylate cyclase domain-containing protein [Actinomycetota bacterium]
MRELPSGTVTFLFSDIEGSTRLLHELGERYSEVLAEHRRLLRDAFSVHGGVEVDTQGDAFFVAFARASEAVAAAAEAQEALADGPVRVRIGIHTGEPVVTEGGYVGVDVHRAARIMGAGHGGQVLLSETTQRLLDPTAELRDLGEHRLKDLGAPHRLYQLGDDDFPPVRALYRTNLPIQSTPLVGRERELEEAGALVRSHRLLTLTGPGGSGKTRLALQLAAEAVEEFPDGVFWVPLQALRDPALVERAIGASVGADDSLTEYVANKRLLVLLDNFEQVVEAAPTVSSLLAGTPNATVLVTSREPLHVESEQRYPVEPLPDNDAAVLFVERASAVAPGLRPTAAVGEICQRLDGLPLAIELAAARVALLDPDELLVRLDRRLPLLASRSRDAPARQRTLRATIEWSYELLRPQEQELFRRLAVFRGSFSLEAAEAVCDADLDALESLVIKNLVRRWGSGRLGTLDTIREYALELLDAALDADDVYRRHAEHFLSVAEEANLNAGTRRPGGQRLDIGLAEQDNFRGALAWALRSKSIALGLEIATALEQLWTLDDPSEGIRWFERLFDRSEAELVSQSLRAEALRAYGSSLGLAGRHAAAEEMWVQSLALFEQLEDEHGRAVLLHRLGIIAMWRGELARARELVELSDEIHERTGDVWGRAQTIGTLGAIARDEGDEHSALDLVRESALLARQARVPWWESGALAELAWLSLNAGLVDEGEAHARESLAIADRLRDRPGRIFGVGILAQVAAERGQRERAGRLWGAIEDEHAEAPLGGWRRHREACEARIREAAGPEFERGYAEGRELTLAEAVSLALATPDVAVKTASAPDSLGSS